MPTFTTRPRWSASLLIVLVGLISLIGPSSLFANTTQSDYDVGVNDFRISELVPNGLAVAYNSQNNEYLVIWTGFDSLEFTDVIYGQRIDAATGKELGENDFIIIDADPPAVNGGDSFSSLPDVVYNPLTNEYLVTWSRSVSLVGELIEGGIYGQRLDAATGAEIGVDDFRIDDPDDPYFSIGKPAVAYNSQLKEYFVVWPGNRLNVLPEILVGQKLDIEGERLGTPITEISDSILLGIDDFEIAYNSDHNEYLVVWNGEESGLRSSLRIQRLDATTGAEVGPNDARISAIVDRFARLQPAIVYNATAQEYLVVWVGEPDEFDDLQIYGQRLSATGVEVGKDDFVISQFGSPDGANDGKDPAIVYNPNDNQYLVTWAVTDRFTGFFPADIEKDAYGQLLDGNTGAEIGINDFRISDYGVDGDPFDDVFSPEVAYNEQNNEYLSIWYGTNAPEETGIFGQRLSTRGAVIGQP